MDKAHKQRLVGGIVLLALALILVPTILDFSQDKTDPMQQAEIPASPEAMQMEVLPLEVWSEPIDPEVDGQEGIVESPDSETQDKTPAVAEKTPAPEPEKQVAAGKPEAAPQAPKPAADGSAKSTIPPGATAWVVQIASFSDQPKAFRLRDRLRKAGHPTFIERGRSGGAAIYRVKVGPVLQRAEADQLKRQVAEQTDLEGLVMKYR